MVQKPREMIRVAFALPEDERWTGGVNYLHNLLFALGSLEDRELEPILFAGDQVDESILHRFEGLAHVERSPLFNRHSMLWKVRRSLNRLTGQDFFCRRLLAGHEIDIASHCNLTGWRLPFKTINWIPDFQHLHLPEMFPSSDLRRRDRKYGRWARESDLLVLSSQDARKDCLDFAPGNDERIRVLHFVSQANPQIYALDDCRELCEKHTLPEKFFYLPNQFWKHKNHLTVVKALAELKRNDIEVHVVCSGLSVDLKDSDYGRELAGCIENSGLQENFHILGLIDYAEVLTLFRHAVSIINPSFFEGWSSTVEEAKSVGKSIILSDIPVHREQNPSQARFFPPDDVFTLASILQEEWLSRCAGPDLALERRARAALPGRTKEFGEAYKQIAIEVMGWTRR